MNAQAKPNEPSMEEILASIRRIISDDEAKPAEAEVEAPAPEPVPASIDDDVLDLGTEAAFVAPPAVEPPPAPTAPAEAEADVDFRETEESEPPAPAATMAPVESTPAPVAAPQPEPAPRHVDMASLLSDQASSAVTSAFGQLANTVLSSNARTLEDLVKDMLKPMLKTWLDDNLPLMVERLVRAEIERVARGGRS
jgi:cell pole-organizing protein PopZ